LSLSGCTGTVDLSIPDQSISTTEVFEGCDTIDAANIDITGTGDVTFQAGESIAIGSGFSVASGASFVAAIDPGLTGDASLEDQSPTSETRYVARFYVNLDSMSLPSSEQLQHFVGFNNAELPQFRIGFKHNDIANEDRLFVEIRQDNGAFLTTEGSNELEVPAGWHAIEVDWTAATGVAADNGSIVICVDDDGSRMGCEQISSVDNDLGRVEGIQWGAKEVEATTSGTFDMDDFDSRRAGPIGL